MGTFHDLTIDSNSDNLALIEYLLDNKGYTVLKAIGAEEGLSLLKEKDADLNEEYLLLTIRRLLI